MLLVLLVAVGNFALGFGLAAYLGHGPAWARLLSPQALRIWLHKAPKRKGHSEEAEHSADT